MKDKSVAIIGLGLIGGSLARALHERLGINSITAVDRSIDSINQAMRDGNIRYGFTEVNEYVWNSDIIFLCTPVKHTIDYIRMLAGKVKPGCIITDVGSTKSEIIRYVNNLAEPLCFIGGHPMAGAEKTGYEAGSSHLFENAYYILTPGRTTSESCLECLLSIVRGIGGIPVVLDAEEHDKITGSISHVPHVIASALVNMVRELESADGKMQMLAAGGFKDITRIASSSPEMWENIVLSNGPQIRSLLDSFTEVLDRFKMYIDSAASKEIYSFFEDAKNFRDQFPGRKKGLINPVYDIVADVEDKPGIIGEIATILGKNGVNIKNINVSNSREYEQGCLRITLPDPGSMNMAFDLLCSAGYKVYKT